jgi:hypothetical protein
MRSATTSGAQSGPDHTTRQPSNARSLTSSDVADRACTLFRHWLPFRQPDLQCRHQELGTGANLLAPDWLRAGALRRRCNSRRHRGADTVQLVLPKTGVCSTVLGVAIAVVGPQPAKMPCCVPDEAAKTSGEAGWLQRIARTFAKSECLLRRSRMTENTDGGSGLENSSAPLAVMLDRVRPELVEGRIAGPASSERSWPSAPRQPASSLTGAARGPQLCLTTTGTSRSPQ